MSHRTTESPLRTLRRLWQRAPAWRATAWLAGSLTLLCLLFAPRNAPPGPPQAVAAARYTPQPAAVTPPPAPAPTVAPTSSAAPPAATPVQTAQLSLATPEASPSVGGLNSALAGHRFSGSVQVNGFNVPLPAGEWLLLANLHFKLATASGEQLLLGRVQNRRLMGAMQVTAARSNDAPGAGFPKVPGCAEHTDTTHYVNNEGVEANGHQACWIIDPMFLTPMEAWADRSRKLPPLLRAGAGDLAAKGVTYPQDMLSLRFSRAERWGLLEVRYDFNPEEAHIHSRTVASLSDSDWWPSHLAGDPDKVAYVDKLRRWGTAFWPRFQAAFDEGKPTAAPR